MVLLFTLVVVALPKNGRWMNGEKGKFTENGVDELAALFHDRYRLTGNRLRGRSPEADKNLGLYYFYFDLEPRPACNNLANRRLLMQAPLATPDPLEMLHRIGHVYFIAGNSRVFKRPIKHAAGWPYEGFTFLIFYVARLLTHQHHTCMAGPIAKNGLSSIEVEITSFARFCRLPERFKRTSSGQEIAGRNVSSFFDRHIRSLSLGWFESR